MRVLFWSILLFVMWMILTSNTQMPNILLGIVLSVSIALLYITLFPQNEFEFIHPIWLVVYIYILAKNIVISNIQMAKRTLSKDMQLSPAIVAVKTNLKSDWKKLLLANSITLTPGTLTLDIKDDTLYIHIIECKDAQNKEHITQEFEDVIAKL